MEATPAALSDSASLVARAIAVHLRHRTGDSLEVLEVSGFVRDSLGVVITIYPECPAGLSCLGGGTRTRVWRGDSATLVGLER